MGRLICISCAFLFGMQLLSAQRPNWVVNESLFQQSATMICSANINGVYLNSPNDLVAAFVGNECRGVVKPVFVPSADRHLFFLVIFSNTQGELLSFRVYNSTTDKVIDIEIKLNFQINQQIGSLFQPFSLAFPRLKSEANVLNFDLSNMRYDSMINRVDPFTGLSTYNFHVRFGQKKDSAIFTYRISQGAKLFLNQVEVISGVTVIDQRIMRQFQVKSEDEASLTSFNVNLINAPTPTPVCEDTVNNNPRPIITASRTEFCTGDSALLTSTPAVRYLWSNGDTASSIRIKNGGNFTVMAIYANGCRSISNAQSIIVNTRPPLPVVENLSVCSGSIPEQLSATATAGNLLRWYGTLASGGTASATAPNLTTNTVGITNIYVSQISAKGCESDRARIIYTVNPLPTKPLIAWNGEILYVTQLYYSYQWLLNNNIVSSANAYQHKPLIPGSYRIIVSNNTNCTDTSSSINLLVTSLIPQQNSESKDIIVYPNPVEDELTVDLYKFKENPIKLILLNSRGQVVKTTSFIRGRIQKLNLNELVKGIYVLVVHGISRTSTIRVIKK